MFYKGDVCFLKYQRRVEIIFMGVRTFVFHPCRLPSATLVSLFFMVFSLLQDAPKCAPVWSHDRLFIVFCGYVSFAYIVDQNRCVYYNDFFKEMQQKIRMI